MNTPHEALEQAIEALSLARNFIRNGVALGFIRMPDADCPDPAHETPGKIDAAHGACRAAIAAMGEQKPWKCACGANLFIDADGKPRSKATQPAASAPVVQPETSTAVFCWLVELFESDGSGNSAGIYHTGLTDIGGYSRSTRKVNEAKRYTTKVHAEQVAKKLGTTLTGTWKAVEHGFHSQPAPTPAPVVQPELHAAALDEIQRLHDKETMYLERLEKLEVDGPIVRRGTHADGTPWMGTMREVLEDYKLAASVEAEARRKAIEELHSAQTINNQEYPRQWHEGVDAALETLQRLTDANTAVGLDYKNTAPVRDEREAFEAWADDQGFVLTRTTHGDTYQDLRTQGPWEAWRAALASKEKLI